MFNHLHETEYFDMNQTDWDQDLKNMANANQALSYISFKRDLNIFKNENPNLDLIFSERINDTFSHIMSGGLNYKKLIPNSLTFVPYILEMIVKPINYHFCLHHLIVLRKR